MCAPTERRLTLAYTLASIWFAAGSVAKAAETAPPSAILPDWTASTWLWLLVLVVGLGVANVLAFRMILNKRLEALEQRLVEPIEAPRLPEPILDLARYADKFESLTPREREILGFLCRGESNKRIAVELGISEKNVEFYRKTLIDKTGVRSIGALVHVANKLGLDR